MDGFFVDTLEEPFTFYAVEAKSSILPTDKSPAKGHRYGILKELIASLEKYGPQDNVAYRFIRSDGSPLFSTAYDEAYSFVLGRAPVREGRERAWIDESGKAVFHWND